MSMRESLQKTFIKLTYEPCDHADVPKDCREVQFIGDPKFALDLFGSKLLDVALTTEGAGGVILLIQLASYVRFQLGFERRRGGYTFEYHFVMISMPVAFKLEGPRMAASIAGGKDIKLINIASLLTKALVAMQEVEKVTKILLELRGSKGFCHIGKLKADLRELEKRLTEALDAQKVLARDDGSGLARIMGGKSYGTARFAGAPRAWA